LLERGLTLPGVQHYRQRRSCVPAAVLQSGCVR
jgi:hypothetical protein